MNPSEPRDFPAFPVSGELPSERSPGMTLRDYFAVHCPLSPHSIEYADKDAAHRYAWADAMLQARKS